MGHLRKKDRIGILQNANLAQSQRKIASQTGIARSSLQRDLKDKSLQKIREQQINTLAKKYYEKAIKALEEEDIPSKTAAEQATKRAIYGDKFALMSGMNKQGDINIDQRQITFKIDPSMQKMVEAEGNRNK